MLFICEHPLLTTRRRQAVTLIRLFVLVVLSLSCTGDPTAVLAGPPAVMLIVSGNEQTATVGSELPTPVVVRVSDASGDPVSNQIINFRVIEGGGSVFAGASITNAEGEARERWTLGTVAGVDQRLEARAVDPNTGDPLVFATFHATAVAAAASKIAKASTDGGQAPGGTALTPSPSVRVLDQYDNPVAGTTVIFAVASGGGSLTGPTQTTNANGIATVGSWTLGPNAGPNTLTATAAGLTGSPVTFTVTGNSVALVLSTLSARSDRSCGLTNAGAAYCWGSNDGGQLGDGTTVSRLTPIAVQGGLAFLSLVTGDRHTCGLTSAGAAFCWGLNDFGQLGDGTTMQRLAPVAVQGGLVFTSLTAGNAHTCGLTTMGKAHCWGYNVDGQLGDGTTTNRLAPVAVQSALVFTVLAGGNDQHTCGLTNVGAAYCWGFNEYGSLGDGTTTTRLTPVAVEGGLVFTALTTGNHSCGLTNAGAAYCWGFNDSGQLGDGTTTRRLSPVAVQGGLVFAALAPGNNHTCGLTTASQAYCWGYNEYGEVGDGTTVFPRLTPVAVQGPNFTVLALGSFHTCGITAAGAGYCWGKNTAGQLGDGTTNQHITPIAIAHP
jgi:alpha-tubulin suppressor-like RCC1 family protein